MAIQNSLPTTLKWAGGFVAAVVISPFVFLAVKGVIGLAIALAVGGALVYGAPWASIKPRSS
jgi:hypothetical protein